MAELQAKRSNLTRNFLVADREIALSFYDLHKPEGSASIKEI
jgi:hypothetical protein